MRYSITFRNLPFEPERRQVIYVENQYNERINTIIKDNYERLKWIFKHSNLDFVYLPMFFNDEEIKEKVLYYAPYLTEEIIEKAELRSSYLLGYMKNLENKGEIAPSLLFVPKKEDEEWIFQGQTIDLDFDNTNEIIHWFEDIIFEIYEELASEEVHRCIRYDEDLEEPGTTMSGAGIEESPQVEYSSAPMWDKLKKGYIKFGKSIVEEGDSETTDRTAPPRLDEIQEEDFQDIIENLENCVRKLRLGGMALTSIHELIDKHETISRLHITDDLRILLPDYGNMEIKMSDSYKAIYLFFLFNPKGIILKRLEDFHSEIVFFFKKTTGFNELNQYYVNYINNLEQPGNNQINVILLRIREAFEKRIDKHIAKNYIITGKAGNLYKIQLDPNLIEWEDENE